MEEKIFKFNGLKREKRTQNYFHGSMIQCINHNRIISIKNGQGNNLMEHQDIEQELVHYFQTLLMEPKKDRRPSIQKSPNTFPP
jgi:hypothetical protein